jgi:hypothetical protein
MRIRRKASWIVATFAGLNLIGCSASPNGGEEEQGTSSQSEMLQGASPTSPVRFTPIGDPVWQFVDPHFFSALVGADGSQVIPTGLSILNPPGQSYYTFNPSLGFGPDQPNPGPYFNEIGRGLARAGIATKRVLSPAEFEGDNGIWLGFMAIPSCRAPFGKSPDAPNGRIIPDAIFPITGQGVLNKDGNVYDPYFSITVPKMNDALPGNGYQGYSKAPFFAIDTREFAGHAGEDPTGHYVFEETYTDASGAGWTLRGEFDIR